MQSGFVFSSESVSEGHPDKLCDRISDAVVGHYLRLDPRARVVAECALSTGIVFVSVRARSRASSVDVVDVVRATIRRIGYRDPALDADRCAVMTSIAEAPPAWRSGERVHPPLGDDEIDELTAQDQATVFGYACRQTPELMPLPIVLAHALVRRMDDLRHRGDLPELDADAKVQVSIEYAAGRPRRVYAITLLASQQSNGDGHSRRLERHLRERVIEPVFADREIRPDARTRIAVNPDGPIVHGGPAHHAGLTGRKTAVDTYGEYARHSGAALSGKDPSRIDRSGAYAARHAAKNVVAAGLAEQCEIALTYGIGLADPVSVQIETWGTSTIPEDELAARVVRAIDLRVGAILQRLGLRRLPHRDEHGFYPALATYGHFGREDLRAPWEALDAVDALRAS
ncbi:methionine adenosyltransferase [Sandaracinus amylolyticus]|uniref:methionine adenosyltransferase n=1 Tax=Sandaracinus amylolyticus TaxID=927083 RepID=UPI001F1F0A0F|nr:methionine adenosyltransferase [Sandaracinus amylolyticus]UJR86361.1 Hypothetical protein I5071_84550 [Sandaracinus amylolyticus]